MPRWEELLLFNDNFETVFEMEKNKNVVMFFEIIDFLPMSVANKNYNRYGQKGKYSVTHSYNGRELRHRYRNVFFSC